MGSPVIADYVPVGASGLVCSCVEMMADGRQMAQRTQQRRWLVRVDGWVNTHARYYFCVYQRARNSEKEPPGALGVCVCAATRAQLWRQCKDLFALNV